MLICYCKNTLTFTNNFLVQRVHLTHFQYLIMIGSLILIISVLYIPPNIYTQNIVLALLQILLKDLEKNFASVLMYTAPHMLDVSA